MPRRIHRFDIKEHLGTGGMGSVYRATDPQLERDVAIKVMGGAVTGNATLDLVGDAPCHADDLVREARMMARLAHPNVVAVHEVDRAGELVFVVMEYVPGSNLATWLRTPRTTRDICNAFAQAARGLAAAHAAGIVHRDFKPENVLVGFDGRARVADFGLSCCVAPRRPSRPRIDDRRGTPRYVAPELLLGASPTPASDVYAFCIALSDALAGHEVSPVLRAAIVAGAGPIACARPPLARLLGALEVRRRPRARWVAAGVIAVASAIGVAGGVELFDLSEEPAAAAPATPLLAGRWDPVRRGELAHALGASADRVVRVLDAQQRAIEDAVAAAHDAPSRLPCLERRAIELGVVVDVAISAKLSAEALDDALDDLPRASDCTQLAVEPLPDDRRRLVELYRMLAVAPALAHEARAATLAELVPAAAALGDHELAVRGELARAALDVETGRLDDADTALERAAADANSAQAPVLAAAALAGQSEVSAQRGDPRMARALAQRAAAASDLPPALLARIHAAAAHAATGDHATVVAEVGRAREAIANTGRDHQALEQALRFDLIPALPPGEAVEVARDTVELVRDRHGALGIAEALLADALVRADNPAGALPHRQRALAEAADEPAAVRARLALARDLAAAHQTTAARDEYKRALAQLEHAPELRALLPETLAALAALGRRSEATHLLERAVAEATALADPRAGEYRIALADIDLDLGQLAAAEHQIVEAERAFAADRARLALVEGLQRTRLLLARHRPRAAEPVIRAALAAWDELHGADRERAELLRSFAACMLALHRYGDAHLAFSRARSLDATQT